MIVCRVYPTLIIRDVYYLFSNFVVNITRSKFHIQRYCNRSIKLYSRMSTPSNTHTNLYTHFMNIETLVVVVPE